MCKCCEGKNNFADAGIKIDTDRHRVYLCGGNSKPPEDEQFDFCPKCGTPLGEIKPLTMEQLREMDGKPVDTALGLPFDCPNSYWWAITETIPDIEEIARFYGILSSFRLSGFDDCGTTWIAYDRELINKK